MSTRASAAVARTREGPLSIEPVELDELRPDELLVRLEACGICHTDEKFRQRLALPAVLGHEGVGVIVAVGARVDDVSVGDRVILSYPSCAVCAACHEGRPFHCEKILTLKFAGCRTDGTRPVSLEGTPITSAFFQQSSFATHAVTLASAVIPVADNVPSEVLAALPCGVQTGAGAIMNTFAAGPDDSLVVVGAGAVGLSAIMAAQVNGVRHIICIEPNEHRRALAAELGASAVFDADDAGLAALTSAMPGGGADLVLESSATVVGLELAIGCVGRGGAVGIVSFPNEGEPFPFSTRELFMKTARLVSVMQGSSVPREFIPQLIAHWQAGRFPVERLISTYPFADINQALADASSGIAVKPVLLMQ